MKDHTYRPRRLPSILNPARYLADPRRLCRGCRIKAGWQVEP